MDAMPIGSDGQDKWTNEETRLAELRERHQTQGQAQRDMFRELTERLARLLAVYIRATRSVRQNWLPPVKTTITAMYYRHVGLNNQNMTWIVDRALNILDVEYGKEGQDMIDALGVARVSNLRTWTIAEFGSTMSNM